MPDYDNTPPGVIAPAGFTLSNVAPAAKAHAYAPDNTAAAAKAHGLAPDNTEAEEIAHGFAQANDAPAAIAHGLAPDNTAPAAIAHGLAQDNTAPVAKAHNLTPDNTPAAPYAAGVIASLPAMPSVFTPAFTSVEELQALTASVADANAGRIIQGTINGQLKSYQIRAGADAEDLPGIVRLSNFDAENNAVVAVQL